jgi:hypothetical protein
MKLTAGETPLVAFISSVMDDEMAEARRLATEALRTPRFITPWAFEYTPASPEPPDETYLRKVRGADCLIWLAGNHTTGPVKREVEEALAAGVPIVAVILEGPHDKDTTSLIGSLKRKIKWVEVEVSAVGDAVAFSLSDELVRRWRANPPTNPRSTLEEAVQLSRARSIERWLAVGLTRNEALALVDDPEIGRPPDQARPSLDQPLKVVLGDMGVGKSLAGERLHQAALTTAASDPDAPFPLWLQAREAGNDLISAVDARAAGHRSDFVKGVTVVIDGADEVGLANANELLRQARILVEARPGTTVVITSRPVKGLQGIPESIEIPLLTDEAAWLLVTRFADGIVSLHRLTPAVQDAIRRPLFALALAAQGRVHHDYSPTNEAELLRGLVEIVLTPEPADSFSALCRLGRLVVDRGLVQVPLAEFADPERQRLSASRLVVERDGAVDFALPILAYWFAAQSLTSGEVEATELISDSPRMDLWREALALAIGDVTLDRASAILDPIARADPAFASDLVQAGLRPARSSGRAGVQLREIPTGEAIRESAASWLDGLAPLSARLPMALEDGSPRPVAVRNQDDTLLVVWLREPGDGDVTVLDGDFHPFTTNLGPWQMGQPGYDPAWPWLWSHRAVVNSLSPWVRGETLPVADGPILEEAIWEEAIALLDHGSLYNDDIALQDIEAKLAELDRWAQGREVVKMAPGGHWRYLTFANLRRRVEVLRSGGAATMSPPWPGPDLEMSGGWIWGPYSPERIAARVTAVLEATLAAYADLVRTWLPKVAPRLTTFATLPAKLTGTLVMPASRNALGGPSLTWRFMPLAASDKSSVEITLAEPGVSVGFLDEEEGRKAAERLRAMRPRSRRWLSFSEQSESLSDIFGARPVTERVYGMLARDLERVGLYRQ